MTSREICRRAGAMMMTISMLAGVALAILASDATATPLKVIPAAEPDGFVAELSTTQAGAHSDAVTSFHITPKATLQDLQEGIRYPLKGTIVDLPPGLIGNPQAVAHCTTAQLSTGNVASCPVASQVGIISIEQGIEGILTAPFVTVGLYAMKTSPGELAQLGFHAGQIIRIDASVRPDDQGLRLTSRSLSQFVAVSAVSAEIWGVPADPMHDQQRCASLNPETKICDGSHTTPPEIGLPHSAGVSRAPFVSNPTACDGPKTTTISVEGWREPGIFTSTSDTDPIPTGCNQLEFNPTIEARPSTTLADSPSGLDFNLHIPQNEDPDGFATSHLKDAVVTLPKGLTVNPSSANGLGACSEAQIGIGVDAPNSCPDASKLGTVEIDTPVLENPVPGEIYLAEQNKNPFDSLIALYIAARLPNGQEVKLAGRADTDPVTGQITATFKDNPQLPFEDLHVNLFGGAEGSLRTPASCGTFTTSADLTPWASPEVANATPTDSFQVTQGAGGGACVAKDDQAPHSPAFTSGTVNPTAGAYTPFTLKLARQDGTQPIKSIDTTLPKGLLGKLAGVPYCSDSALAAVSGKSGKAEQASSSCPAASQVGTVNVATGAGPAPLNVGGKAYLAGPYKGAPLSLAVVTPAVAGPFDLGTVVVRVALNVDPASAQIHAVSDPIPTILQGIPLDVRSISLNMARPQFTLNPTSCDPMAVTGSALSAFGQSAALSNPFQVGDCGRLAFKPKLAIRLLGPTHRSAHPKLKATLTMPPGGANIASAQVTLPKTEILDQAHIRTICTRVQYAAKSCPPGSVYGHAKAWSPLLDQPLEGPVYLRSSSHELPDLVASLDGQIHVDLAGRIDSVNARIRNTFEAVPDAPVSKFVLTMQGAKKGLLVNNTQLCKAKPRFDARFDAHSGKAAEVRPLARVDCGKRKKR